jgi:heterodisulfide reductase subunit C/quinone-modifying oxidoreductase subunit QmoC
MYALKRMAVQEGMYQESSTPEASDFSGTFIDFVEDYGRSFEVGLATRYHLRHNPLGMVKMATSMGISMFLKGRFDLTPNRIKDIKGLQAILNKAKELGGES